jgi:acetyl esterase
MPLHPQVAEFLAEIAAAAAPGVNEVSVLQARAEMEELASLQGDPAEVASVRDILVPGAAGELPVRVYDPDPGVPLPLLVYLHGGGWVGGSIEVVDRPCRALARAARCVVATIGFRCSPETKFPGPLEDSYAATAWLAGDAEEIGADGRHLVVAGDSGGGNLAACVALMARDRGRPQVDHQILIYPAIAPPWETDFDSFRENAEGYFMSSAEVGWYWNHYLTRPEEGRNPYAAPCFAEDLSGLAPALVVTAEFDPLRDEGLDYAERLRAAGVEVESRQYMGAIHGFFWMGGIIDHCKELTAEIAERLDRAFHD